MQLKLALQIRLNSLTTRTTIEFHFKQVSRELQNTPALPLRCTLNPLWPGQPNNPKHSLISTLVQVHVTIALALVLGDLPVFNIPKQMGIHGFGEISTKFSHYAGCPDVACHRCLH